MRAKYDIYYIDIEGRPQHVDAVVCGARHCRNGQFHLYWTDSEGQSHTESIRSYRTSMKKAYRKRAKFNVGKKDFLFAMKVDQTSRVSLNGDGDYMGWASMASHYAADSGNTMGWHMERYGDTLQITRTR